MKRTGIRFLILMLATIICLSLWACSSSDDDEQKVDGDLEQSVDGDEDAASEDGDMEQVESSEQVEEDTEIDGDLDAESLEEDAEEWAFDRSNYDAINGWILLDSNPDAVRETIETAARYGVNHVQLSHGLIMDIDDLLEDGGQTRADTLNLGIQLAHENGMKAFVWAHEFSRVAVSVCFDPEDQIWEDRKDAYREALAMIPDVDGVVMMFGSSDMPPWFAMCSCDYCEENYPESLAWERPPSNERVQMVVEIIGGTITDELGKELLIRTFVHEPNEITWHSEGMSAAKGVEFTGMHKCAVQDWQPYNPHHGSTGNIGNHPSVLEMDVAGEYFGMSVLPFCAPGYFWYRMNYLWDHKGIGVVMRVQRGSNHALGTPNEINIHAVNELIKDMSKPLDTIWDEFIQNFYGLAADAEGQDTLKRILSDTFDVRRKSHYVLGIWALEKSSDIPGGYDFSMFKDRGEMPKWDTDWQSVWDGLDQPTMKTVLNIWQEGSEAVAISEYALNNITQLADKLEQDKYDDLLYRLQYQKRAAEVWRAVKVFLWARKAYEKGATDCGPYIAWAYDELAALSTAMTDEGLSSVPMASPARIETFRNAVSSLVPADTVAAEPPSMEFSPVMVISTTSTSAEIAFVAGAEGPYFLDYGLEIPDYGLTVDVGTSSAGTQVPVTLEGLQPGKRYVLRLRTGSGENERLGGDFWIYTPFE